MSKSSQSSKHLSEVPHILGFPSLPEEIKNKFYELCDHKADSKNPDLIEFLKKIIIPPSRHKVSKHIYFVKTPQAEEIDNILKKRNGFFVEAGALDGECASNTLYLEIEKGWTGLLVEPDPYYFTQIIGKNRNSWAINACLSPFNYASKLYFRGSNNQIGRVQLNKTDENLFEVPCFPLQSLLLAIGVKNVDFFSLDVEGDEVPILKSLPFNEIDIKTLAVEYRHGKPQEYLDVMAKKGYNMTKQLKATINEHLIYVDDYIFVKQ
ncbi:hypothetical protein HELRODRAFT_173611 [Helobdella robusta]|uniref:Methyltransferase FkbM domain-containing protein n=1 Tax=Helobdella robusta TaxID=6412 RepID=T1F717_HELRO|nr:hypothetical protein HELRODRAFT_173611 [Helobdella robusta]ESO03325.1 hypothetical protein HELRODRAFT_173611 [Helobdella robusta]